MRVTVNDLEHANELDKLNIFELAFPTRFSSHHKHFKLVDILNYSTKLKKLLIIKGVIHNHELLEVEQLLKDSSGKVAGIIFSDFAVLMICKKYNLKHYLIYDGEMLNTSVAAMNELFNEGLDECVISRELTLEEIIYISENACGKLSMQIQGLYPIFYSVRPLIDNYLQKIAYKGEALEIELALEGRQQRFKVLENERGCIIYTHFEQCLIEKLSLFTNFTFWIDQPFITSSDNLLVTKMYLEQLCGDKYTKSDLAQITKLEESIGFLHKKTLYKLKYE